MARSKRTKGAGNAAVCPVSEAVGGASQSGVGVIGVFVFCSGAVLMALEIVGSRVMAPDFGNSIFTWGSLITVVLAALSLGYVGGGHLADRRPSTRTLGVIGLAAAAAILLVPLGGAPLMAWIGERDFGPRASPLLASVMLFFPASVLLGMASPFAIRLCGRRLESIGRTAGGLYALSTAGSILGTLGTAFVLIPLVGVGAILYSIATLMAAVSVMLMLAASRVQWPAGAVGLLAVGLVAVTARTNVFGTPGVKGKVLFYRESPYHNVAVVDEGNLRRLCFNSQVESGIWLYPPYPTACLYVEMLPLVRLITPEPRRVLFIGCGGGVGPRAFRLDLPEARIDIVEIDAAVVEAAEKYFYLDTKNDPKLRVFVCDGRLFVRNCEERYDVIVLDAYSIHGQVPFHLMTQEFLGELRDHLAPDGAVIMNLIGGVGGLNGRLFQAQWRTFETVFASVYCFPREYYIDPSRERLRNIMLVATDQGPRLTEAEIVERAEQLVTRRRVSTGGLADYAADYVGDLPREPGDIVLTDDYAPVEILQAYR